MRFVYGIVITMLGPDFHLNQEKFWSLPLRGFRLGRNSTVDLLHLLWPYEKKPDDAWCCNLPVNKNRI